MARQVDRFGNGSGNERLGRRHHANVRFRSDVALSALAALVCAVENRVVFRLEIRGPLDGHGATNRIVCRLDFLVTKAQMSQEAELVITQLLFAEAQSVLAKLVDKRPAVEHKRNVK